jgi:hypothetical protein
VEPLKRTVLSHDILKSENNSQRSNSRKHLNNNDRIVVGYRGTITNTQNLQNESPMTTLSLDIFISKNSVVDSIMVNLQAEMAFMGNGEHKGKNSIKVANTSRDCVWMPSFFFVQID